tara:strand:+ start:721 stop:867 length:147 start_codon:yes stop_codon:yes gene_type:complete
VLLLKSSKETWRDFMEFNEIIGADRGSPKGYISKLLKSSMDIISGLKD